MLLTAIAALAAIPISVALSAQQFKAIDAPGATDFSQINIFVLGDSTSDPGNMPFEPCPLNHISKVRDYPNIPIYPFFTGVGVLQIRYTPDGVSGDGGNFVAGVADKLDMNYLKGSEVTSLTNSVGNFVNFSLSGADQDRNTYLKFAAAGAIDLGSCATPPPNDPQLGSYISQVARLSHLLANSPKVPRIGPNDIVFYYSIGGNDILLRYYDIAAFGAIGAIGPTNQQYVAAFTQNIDNLYSMGMRKLILGLQTTPNAAFDPILQLAAAGDPSQLNLMDNALADMQAGILANLATRWPGLQIDIHLSGDYLADIRQVANFSLGTYPNLLSQSRLGFWPVTDAFPDSKGKHLLYSDDKHLTSFANKFLAQDVVKWFTNFTRKIR